MGKSVHLSCALALLFVTRAAVAQSYFATSLSFRPTDMNEYGQVVGDTSTYPGGSTGPIQLWTPSSPHATTGTTQTLWSTAYGYANTLTAGINNRGQVVATGASYNSPVARLWTPSTLNGTGTGTYRAVTGLTEAGDINDLGMIVGRATNGGGYVRLTPLTATTYTTTPITLPTNNHMPGSDSFALTESGQIVGSMIAYDGMYATSTTLYRDYGFALAAAPDSGQSVLFDRPSATGGNVATRDVNEAGIVVGGDGYDAVRWTRDAQGNWVEQPIVSSQNGSYFTALKINNTGTIAGVEKPSGPLPGTAWVMNDATGGQPVHLDQLLDPVSGAGLHVTNVNALNDHGQIAVQATNASGYWNWFLLTPAAPGDSDYSGSVEFTDLLALAKHYGNPTAATWRDGDFNGDGAVDFSDLLTLARNYGHSGMSTADLASQASDGFVADWALAESLVPEPGVAMLAAGTMAVTALRRRRRSR